MPKKISKKPIKQKREKKRLTKLAKAGRLIQGVEIPEGVLAADLSQQATRGGYSGIRYFYKDVEFICKGCGKKDVWTAEQQKRYYEDQKGNIYNEATWCHDCHTKRMKKKQEA